MSLPRRVKALGRIMAGLVSGVWVPMLLVAVFGVVLNVPSASGQSGTIYIRADGSIDPPAPISTFDNITYTFTGDISDALVVERDDIVIDGAGYTVTGNGSQNGTTLTGRSNVTVGNMTIKNFYTGIWLLHSSNNVLSGNNVANNTGGIALGSSFNNSVSGNNLTASSGNGIYLSSSFNNSVSGNNLTANSDYGIALDSSCHDNSVSGNNVANHTYGIGLGSSFNNVLSGNTVANNTYGIGLWSSFNNSVSGNNLTASSGNGIYLSSSFNNSVSGNNLTANSDYGIALDSSCHDNSVSGNNVANHTYGIGLGSSFNNSVSGNNVANNTYGIGLWSSSNNKIYHNSFNNTYQAYSEGSVNVWDDGYPSGGNYWSDYTDVDFHSGPYRNETGSDGIGDSLHVIDANNTDQYPLMGTFSNFNVTSEHNVQTVCNSTISDFQLNGTAIRFNIFGEDGTTGFCRISIPTALMNDSYGVYVNGTEIPYSLLACSNSTHSYLYFNYTHSTQEVIIIPEHPSFLIAPLFMAATLLAIIVYKGKHTSKVNGR
jgi:parallel beta-helix repeat protein